MNAGFSSGQYFAKVFRKQFGCTPNLYRSAVPNTAIRRAQSETNE